jgi:hypothetical protein
VQIVGQLALTQLGLDITIGPQESFGHQDLVMPRLVGDLKHMGLKVLLPPGVPDLAGKFTLKVPAYGIDRLGRRMTTGHTKLLLICERGPTHVISCAHPMRVCNRCFEDLF